jgi:hypothetical protein
VCLTWPGQCFQRCDHFAIRVAGITDKGAVFVVAFVIRLGTSEVRLCGETRDTKQGGRKMRGGRFKDLETRVRTAGAVGPRSLVILRDLSLS